MTSAAVPHRADRPQHHASLGIGPGDKKIDGARTQIEPVRQDVHSQHQRHKHEPETLHTSPSAGIVIISQPNLQTQSIDNAIEVPAVLSFLTYRAWTAEVRGLDAFHRDQWPDTIPLL